MNNAIRTAIYALKDVPSRNITLAQLSAHGSPAVVKELIDVLFENNLPEVKRLVIPLLDGLRSENFADLELSVCGLLRTGHSCIPYLRKYLIEQPSNMIAFKIKEEIEQLEEKLSTSVYSTKATIPSNNEENISVQLSERMIGATKISVSWEAISGKTLRQRRLRSMIEINIDAWENARREIIACNGHAMSFLQATLMDSTDVEFRRVAARMLALLHYKDSIATLIEALKDNDAIVRNEAILALTKQPSDVVATHILDLANSINGC